MKKGLLGLAALVGSFSFALNVQAAPIDDAWNKVVKDGVFEASCVEPTRENDPDGLLAESSTHWYLQETFGDNYGGTLYLNQNNEYVLDIYIIECKSDGECNIETSKDGVVNVKWKETNPSVRTLIDEYAKKVDKLFEVKEFEGGSNKEFLTEVLDVSRISGIKNSKYGNFYAESALHYSDEMIKIFGNSNIDYKLTGRLGDAGPFYGLGGGDLTLWYNGVAYQSLVGVVGVSQFDILYIPEQTELNTDAFITAAKKRLDENFGANVIDVKLGGVFEELDSFEEYNKYVLNIDRTKTGDNYYKLKINGKDYNFIIMKNSDIKSLQPVESKDIVTNIAVKTTSPDVPMDTKVIVNEVKKDTQEFKNFVETLKKDVVKAFDISLHSNSKGAIKKLDKGVFEVSLPLGLEYVGRRLSAYYVREDGSLEEHPITLDKDGNAVFETTHFSTYFIADATNKLTEEVPKTFDKADVYMMLAISGAIGLFASIIFFRTKSN